MLHVQGLSPPLDTNSLPLRPQHSTAEKIRPLPLVENNSEYVKYSPKKKHMKERKLFKILGKDFDPNWMSIDKPRETNRGQSNSEVKPDGKLIHSLKKLNFTFFDDTGQYVRINPKLQHIFEDWLMRKASCPVRYVWEDVGALFWPRYVKTGECVNDAHACSWPPGMHCIPAESRTIYVLRWHCRRRGGGSRGRNPLFGFGSPHKGKNKRKKSDELKEKYKKRKGMRMRCRWIKVPYPVTADCYCSC